MKIDRVTMTGPDDSIRPEDLVAITKKYPFVEWGILISKSQEGWPRFPSRKWMNELKEVASAHNFRLSGHLCGRWVRELVTQGNFTWAAERSEFQWMFQRLQLNFHADPHVPAARFWSLLKHWSGQFIFQVDGENESLFRTAAAEGVNAVPLFDVSGGAGIVPDNWPKPIDGVYCGYAGGLGPETIVDQLKRIESVVGDRTIWIDMETRIRSNEDRLFDLDKVVKCLELANPWIC